MQKMAEVRLCCNNWRDQRKTEGTGGCTKLTIETGGGTEVA